MIDPASARLVTLVLILDALALLLVGAAVWWAW